MRLISWNVNGIRAVQKKGFLAWLNKAQPDILCLQETKATPDQLQDELLHIPGYTACWSSAEKKGYSGTVIYSKPVPLKVRHGFGLPRFDSEGRVVLAEYRDFTLLNIYFPNGKKNQERLAYKMDFYAATLEYCQKLQAAGQEIIICGDVNTAHQEIDLAHPRENADTSGFLPSERAWLDKLLAAGFVDTFRHFHSEPGQYTWWDYKTHSRERNIGWRIDYFFVTTGLAKKLQEAFILNDVFGSDHCPLGIVIAG
ncbi:exodeoxyribonuclease III [Candidatus Termititenax persephonae]|uniref:Exodeoxyribonuclease III n=1 Tax=Candidatus Termititenax persephonae TaxID=2218525 RepID=A0A388TIH1_9BACT|nr:exodeoxyribonuclease III [Candidatus Termititenax persephonae]